MSKMVSVKRNYAQENYLTLSDNGTNFVDSMLSGLQGGKLIGLSQSELSVKLFPFDILQRVGLAGANIVSGADKLISARTSGSWNVSELDNLATQLHGGSQILNGVFLILQSVPQAISPIPFFIKTVSGATGAAQSALALVQVAIDTKNAVRLNGKSNVKPNNKKSKK